jgi:hypothetical protein
MTKRCPDCDTTKPITLFYKNKASKDGLHPYCIECAKVRAKDWQQANPEKMRAKSKRWYLANREKVIARVAEWVKKNPMKRSEQMRRFYMKKKMREAA